ncbi:MAG: hypothetical protein HY703_11180 [Gemmatimonadetes bacterium]|nr:hypothetical protein [Gemmatimonadota bacterium]
MTRIPESTLPLCALAVVLAAVQGSAQTGRLWRPDERVLLTAFHELSAVAVDARRVYAASPWGLEVYDFVARSWLPPITAEDGYPAGERVTAMVYDEVANALWLGTARGELLAYRLVFGGFERYGVVADGPVLQIVPGRDVRENALYLAVPGGWQRVRRGSSFAETVPPDQVPGGQGQGSGSAAERLGRMDPFFHSLRGTLEMDERLRHWPISDVAPAASPGRYWVATYGGNLLLYDSRRMDAERLTFGLPGRGAGALALDGRFLWFGGDGQGARRGIAQCELTLQQCRHFEAGYDGAPAGYVNDVLATGVAIWFAAADGLFRYDRQGRWRRYTEGDGLPAAEARVLARAGNGVWVGTRRGLVAVDGEGDVVGPTLFPGRAIHGLASSRDSLWIAAEVGLWLIPSAGAEPLRAPAAERLPALATAVTDVRPAFGAVFAITPDALYRYDGREWQGPLREAALGGLGRLRTLAAAGDQLWVGGDAGVGRWDQQRREWTYYLVGPDIPEGPVRRVLPVGDHVWVATPAGALRLAWRP